ncbi:MAG: CYTH domain-containing protein [Oscillospiraceae bacterium]|nr:CYTH domain-containing protein [Oscillospiraceae bacterium]MBQ3543323.1 CYTH domain-containing protein [Oscillospiraceae bacterium]
MPKEIELKFAATQAQLEKLQAHYGGFATTKMETTYYDTPDRQLTQGKITLRRRQENGKSICTVKTPGAGLARGEWEVPDTDITHALPELCKLGAPKMLMELPSLSPVCGASFTRLSRLLTLPDGTAELALDRGVLLGGGRELPFCEVELELRSGSEASLAALANSIAAKFSLTPEPRSKFARAREL